MVTATVTSAPTPASLKTAGPAVRGRDRGQPAAQAHDAEGEDAGERHENQQIEERRHQISAERNRGSAILRCTIWHVAT